MVLIYRLRNLKNGSLYVGVTAGTMTRRWCQHRSDAARGRGYRIAAAIRKYGADLFEVLVVGTAATMEEAHWMEQKLISAWRPRYNVTAGGKGVSGVTKSASQKKALSEALKGRVSPMAGMRHTAESKEKMKVALKARRDDGFAPPRLGRKAPGSGLKAVQTKISRGYDFHQKRRPKTDAEKAKISAAKTGIPRPPLPDHVVEVFRNNMRRAAAARRRPVICLTDGQIFPSARHASVAYGHHPTAVNSVCSGRVKTLGGRRFEWLVQ